MPVAVAAVLLLIAVFDLIVGLSAARDREGWLAYGALGSAALIGFTALMLFR
jgi:hypothetical protein